MEAWKGRESRLGGEAEDHPDRQADLWVGAWGQVAWIQV